MDDPKGEEGGPDADGEGENGGVSRDRVVSDGVADSESAAQRAPEVEGLGRRGAALMWRMAKAHPRPLAIALLGAAGFSVVLVLTTVVMGWVTDEVIIPSFEDGAPDRDALSVGMILIGLLALGRAVSAVLRRYFGYVTVGMNRRSIRNDLGRTYLDAPMEFHRRRSAGTLLAHADADTIATTDPLMAFPFTIGVMVLVAVALVSLLLIDLAVTLVALVLFPLLAVVSQLYVRRVEGPQARVQERIGQVSSSAHESFDGALIVKLLGLEEVENERFRDSANRLRSERLEVGRLASLLEPTIDALPNVGVVALLAVGAWRVSNGAMSEGQVVQAMYLFNILAFPVRVVGFFLQSLPRGVVGMTRIDEVFDEQSDGGDHGSASGATPRGTDRHGRRIADTAPAPLVGATGPVSLEVTDLVFGHDDEPVLHGVSFEIGAGESVALVGGTGAGKSTLISLLCRLEHGWSGQIRLGGDDIETLDESDLRRRVIPVLQESFLFGDTVRENLDLGFGIGEEDRLSVARMAAADGFISELPDGYETIVGERGMTLSGGQRQRIALARGLLRRPGLLLLDDATSAVDPTIEAQILERIGGGAAMSTLIVAHRLSTIRLADRVLYLDQGRIVADGTHEELLANQPDYLALVSSYESGRSDAEQQASAAHPRRAVG